MRALWWIVLVAGCEKSGTLDDPPPPELEVALVGTVTAAPPAKPIPKTIQVDIPPVDVDAGVDLPDGGVAGPVGRVTISNKQAFDESTLLPDIVLAKIQTAYVLGIKRCYKNYLNKDPSARGKIKLNLTVNETGRTVNARATGFAAEIDDCITGSMGSWRFPSPKDRDGEATEASFAITLQLVPD